MYLTANTIRYDTMEYINVRLKAGEYSQLNLPHGATQKRIMKKLKTKNGDAQKKRSGREVHGVSPKAGRESMGGKICERGRS